MIRRLVIAGLATLPIMARADPGQKAIDAVVAEASLAEVLALRVALDDELARRGVIRNANLLTGQLAEHLFVSAMGWQIAPASQKGYDAKDGSLRIQIKARRDYGQAGARQLSSLRDLDGFDRLAVVIFDRLYRVEVAATVPAALVASEAKYVAYTKSFRFFFDDGLLSRPGVEEVTETLRRALGDAR